MERAGSGRVRRRRSHSRYRRMFTRRRIITTVVVIAAFVAAMVVMSLVRDFLHRLDAPDEGGAAPPAAVVV